MPGIKLSPSSAGRWSSCTRYPWIKAELPYVDNGNGHEGTCAHWVAEEWVKTGNLIPIGTAHSNGVLVDPDMHKHADGFLSHLAPFGSFPNVPQYKSTDQQAPVWQSEAKIKTFYGDYNCIVDLFTYDPRNKVLYVWDYKYGRMDVNAYRNKQLLCYAMSVIVAYNIPVEGLQLNLGIYQPRSYRGNTYSTWNISYEILYRECEVIQEAIREIEAGGVMRCGKHCAYCEVLERCPSNIEAINTLINFENDGPLRERSQNVGGELALLKGLKEALDLRVKTIETEVKTRIEAGETVDGWKIDMRPGKLDWTVDPESILSLGETYGVTLGEFSPITPTQAKKLAIPKPVVEAISARKPSWAKLVQEDNFNPFS